MTATSPITPTSFVAAQSGTATSPPVPFSTLISRGYEIRYASHAAAILSVEFPGPLEELEAVLAEATLPITEIIGSGGGETKFTQRMRRSLSDMGWPKHNFEIKKVVDGIDKQSTSHEVDHVRRTENGVIALEIEWNNKDPFFDRDLDNFKRLHNEGAINVGILITRGTSLQDNMRELVFRFAKDREIENFDDLEGLGYEPTNKQKKAVMKKVDRSRNPVPFDRAWTETFVANKYGAATTHWEKLSSRMDRGVGNPCPLLLIGLPASIVTFDNGSIEQLDEDQPEQDSEAV
jgi:hypothetical protein